MSPNTQADGGPWMTVGVPKGLPRTYQMRSEQWHGQQGVRHTCKLAGNPAGMIWSHVNLCYEKCLQVWGNATYTSSNECIRSFSCDCPSSASSGPVAAQARLMTRQACRHLVGMGIIISLLIAVSQRCTSYLNPPMNKSLPLNLVCLVELLANRT